MRKKIERAPQQCYTSPLHIMKQVGKNTKCAVTASQYLFVYLHRNNTVYPVCPENVAQGPRLSFAQRDVNEPELALYVIDTKHCARLASGHTILPGTV